MSMPKSVTKITKDGLEFTSNVDRAQYTIRELVMRANYDVSRFLMRRLRQAARTSPSLSKLPKNRFKSMFQYWVRKRDNDLQVGFKPNTWYGVDGELGNKGQPQRALLKNTVYENIDEIVKIQGQYLSAVEDENQAIRLINQNGSLPDKGGLED